MRITLAINDVEQEGEYSSAWELAIAALRMLSPAELGALKRDVILRIQNEHRVQPSPGEVGSNVVRAV